MVVWPFFRVGFQPALQLWPGLVDFWSFVGGGVTRAWNWGAAGLIHTTRALSDYGTQVWDLSRDGIGGLKEIWDTNVLQNLQRAPLFVKIPFILISMVLGWVRSLFTSTVTLWLTLYATILVWLFLGLLMWPALLFEGNEDKLIPVLNIIWEIMKWMWNISAGIWNIGLDIARPFFPEWNVLMELGIRFITLLVTFMAELFGGSMQVIGSLGSGTDDENFENLTPEERSAASSAKEDAARNGAGMLSGNDEDFIGFSVKMKPRYHLNPEDGELEGDNEVESILAGPLQFLTTAMNIYARILWQIGNILLMLVDLVLRFLLKIILLLIDVIIYLIKYLVCMFADIGCGILDFLQDVINLFIGYINLATYPVRAIGDGLEFFLGENIFSWLLIPDVTWLACSHATLKEKCIDCKCSGDYGMPFSNLPPCTSCTFYCANKASCPDCNWVQECPSQCAAEGGGIKVIEAGWCSHPEPAGLGPQGNSGVLTRRRLLNQTLTPLVLTMLQMTQSTCYQTCVSGLRFRHCAGTRFQPVLNGTCSTTREIPQSFLREKHFHHRNEPIRFDWDQQWNQAYDEASHTSEKHHCNRILTEHDIENILQTNIREVMEYETCVRHYMFKQNLRQTPAPIHRHSMDMWSTVRTSLIDLQQGKMQHHTRSMLIQTHDLVHGLGTELSRSAHEHLKTYKEGSRWAHFLSQLDLKQVHRVWNTFEQSQNTLPGSKMLQVLQHTLESIAVPGMMAHIFNIRQFLSRREE